jgi:hypothetical protein
MICNTWQVYTRPTSASGFFIQGNDTSNRIDGSWSTEILQKVAFQDKLMFENIYSKGFRFFVKKISKVQNCLKIIIFEKLDILRNICKEAENFGINVF